MKKTNFALAAVLSATLLLTTPVSAVWYYDTYKVVEVKEETFVLEHGEVRVEIEKSRRPELEVGDEVRYDRFRNRLGRTVESDEEEGEQE